MARTYWTPEEDAQLYAQTDDVSIAEMAARLGRTYSGTRSRRRKINARRLPNGGQPGGWTRQERRDMVLTMVQNGMTSAEIAKELGLDRGLINKDKMALGLSSPGPKPLTGEEIAWVRNAMLDRMPNGEIARSLGRRSGSEAVRRHTRGYDVRYPRVEKQEIELGLRKAWETPYKVN